MIYGIPVTRAYESRFPAHGWAMDEHGDRGLFFPVLTVLSEASAVRESKGLGSVGKPAEHALAVLSLVRTLGKLALTLRDIEELARGRGTSSLPDDFGRTMSTFERAPLLIDLAFVYLWRVADRFARAAEPVLFRSRGPRGMRRLLDLATSPKALGRCHPLVDRERLRSVLADQATWASRLRGEAGFRDSLEHDAVEVDIAIVSERAPSAEESRWRLEGFTTAGAIDDELVAALRGTCRGLCSFLTAMHRLVGYGSQYRYSDEIAVRGPEELAIAFWPEII